MLKFLFRDLRFHLSSDSSPFCLTRSRLKNQFLSTLLNSRPPSSKYWVRVYSTSNLPQKFFFIVETDHDLFPCLQLFVGSHPFPLLLQSLRLARYTLHSGFPVQSEGVVKAQAHVLRQVLLQCQFPCFGIISRHPTNPFPTRGYRVAMGEQRSLCTQSETTQASGYSQLHVSTPLLVIWTPDTSLRSAQSIAAPASSSPRRR